MNILYKYSLFIFSFIIYLNSFSQASGYFGKKNFVDIGVDFQMPLMYNFNIESDWNVKSYLNNNGTLEEKKPLLNLGYAISYSRVLTNNIAFGLELYQSNYRVAPNLTNNSVNYYNYQFELLGIRKRAVIPKIAFSYNNALLPIGVSNEIGFGITSYNVKKQDYIGFGVYDVSWNEPYYPSGTVTVTEDNYYNYNNNKIIGYLFLYKLTMRIPINKYLLYHFGFRYTFSFVPIKTEMEDYNSPPPLEYILTRPDVNYSIKRKENRSLFFFDTGITIAF